MIYWRNKRNKKPTYGCILRWKKKKTLQELFPNSKEIFTDRIEVLQLKYTYISNCNPIVLMNMTPQSAPSCVDYSRMKFSIWTMSVTSRTTLDLFSAVEWWRLCSFNLWSPIEVPFFRFAFINLVFGEMLRFSGLIF